MAMANRRSEISECLMPAETRNKTTEESLGKLEDGAHVENVEFSNPELGLRRTLSLLDGIRMFFIQSSTLLTCKHAPQTYRTWKVCLLVGIIIGSGIFTSPGVVLLDAGSVGLGLTAWVAAAFMAMCSALVYAELGAALPQAGGNAEFFRVAFGDAFAFSFIWTMFFVLTNASLAIGAVTFSRYIVAGFTGIQTLDVNIDSDPLIKAVAIGAIAFLTVWNCFGVHLGAGLQNGINMMKFVLLLLLSVAALISLWDNPSVAQHNLSKPFAGSTLSSFGVSCVAALWAFTGWGDLVFLTEELKDPARDIPRGTIGGMSLVAIVYLIINVAYLCILPAAVIKLSAVVAIDATRTALGPWAGSVTSILVGLSVFGSMNGSIICGARYLYSAAREGQIPKYLGFVTSESRSPYIAHLVQALVCIFLLLQSGSFVELLSYFGVSSFLFYGLTAAAHMKIRHDFPDLHRPYTVTFYPYAPLIVICFSLYLVVSTLVANPVPTSLSLAFVAASFPVYYLFVRK